MSPPRSSTLRRLAGGLVAAGLVSACGGAGFDGNVFKNGELSFRVRGVPEGWRRIENDAALLAFRDDPDSSTVLVNGRCGKDGDDVPLSALTHHLFLSFTDRNIETQRRVDMDGREALHTELRARLDGVEKRFTVFVLKKNGCVYDFVQMAPPDAPPEGRQRFVTFVEGFSTIAP